MQILTSPSALPGPLRDPRLRNLVATIRPGGASMIDQALSAQVAAVLQGGITSFPVAPREVLCTGPYLVGYQVADGTPISLSEDEEARHQLYTGPTGGQKTSLVHHHLRTLLPTVRPWILELKGDLLSLAAHHPGMLMLNADTEWAPLRVPTYLPADLHRTLFRRCVNSALYGAESTTQVLTEGLGKSYADRETPSLVDLRDAINGLGKKNDTYSRRDSIRGVAQRLDRLILQYPGLAHTRNAPGVEHLCEFSLYFGVPLLTEIEEFLFTFLVHSLFFFKRSRGRSLTHAIIMDEGHSSWAGPERSSHRIGGQPLLISLQPMTREFGIEFIITTNSFRTIDPILKSNTYLHAFTRLAHAEDIAAVRRTYGLTGQQAADIQCLPPGQFIVYRGNWPHPIHAWFPKIEIEKNITTDEFLAAQARTRYLLSLAPRPAIPSITSPQAPPGPDSALATEIPPITSARPTTRPAPPVPPATPRGIALNTAQEQLLRSVVERIAPVTTHTERLHLHPEEGNNARKQLALLGLITEEPIVARSGRGGRAIALLPTPAGIERSGTQPPKGTKGGDSAQHQYLVQELATLLLGSKAEAMVGTKSVDLLLTYRENEHAALGIALNTIAIPSTRLTEGQVVAIEVEISSPDKTIPPNITKNYAAGIALTVIAVMPKALPVGTRAVAKLDERLRATLTLVDALRLLDHLRSAAGEES